MSVERRCVVFTANRGYALSNSRSSLIRDLVEAGWNVVLATEDDADSRALCRKNIELEPVHFERGGISPLYDYRAYRRLLFIFKKYRPVLVQNFHAKPIIMSSLAASSALRGGTSVVNTVTGLGQAFARGGPTSLLASLGFRSAVQRADVTIFQNRDDQMLFLDRGWTSDANSELVVGAGIDIERFRFLDRSKPTARQPAVVLVARLLKQKGIPEFVDVASCIKRAGIEARFVVAGEEDPRHSDSISADWLKDQRVVEYIGRIPDVEDLLAEADLLLFPSTYREGTPRVVLEAAATGLPVVAFDVPGVREVVQDGVTGYLVEPGDVTGLVSKVEYLLKDREVRLRMGEHARRLVEEKYSTLLVNREYFRIYRRLIGEI